MDYVKQYTTLDARAEATETKAEGYRQKANDDRWEQCRVAYEAIESGTTIRGFAEAVGRAHGHISVQRRMWERFGSVRIHPDYRESYAEIKGQPTGSGATQGMVKRGIKSLPVEEKAAVVKEALKDKAVARAVVKDHTTNQTLHTERIKASTEKHTARREQTIAKRRAQQDGLDTAHGELIRGLNGEHPAESAMKSALMHARAAVAEREKFEPTADQAARMEHQADEMDILVGAYRGLNLVTDEELQALLDG